MHRIGRYRLRQLAAACCLLAASGARAAGTDPETAARAAALTRSGRFEEAAIAWRELAQGLAKAADARPLAAALLTNLGNLDASKEACAHAARGYPRQ